MRGQHDYPFSFRLPDEIPSSIEGKYGYIRYEIEAKVMVKQEQTVFKCVNSHVERFTVLSNVALPLSAQVWTIFLYYYYLIIWFVHWFEITVL